MSASRLSTASAHTFLGTLSIIFLVPIAGMLLAALHEDGSFVRGFGWPDSFNWDNFAQAWSEAGLSRLFRASAVIAAVVVPLVVVLATLAGYGLALLSPPGGRVLRVVLLVGLAIPIEGVIVPLYFTFDELRLSNSYAAVIVAETALFMPFATLWMLSNFEGLPREITDAARIDGASSLAALTKVLVPLSWPAIATLAALLFMWSWNQFLLVLVLIQDPDKRTVPSGLSRFVGQFTTNVPLLSAATLLAITPVLVVYVALQRSFVRGVLQGAIS